MDADPEEEAQRIRLTAVIEPIYYAARAFLWLIFSA
jgi:hypothetical protein